MCQQPQEGQFVNVELEEMEEWINIKALRKLPGYSSDPKNQEMIKVFKEPNKMEGFPVFQLEIPSHPNLLSKIFPEVLVCLWILKMRNMNG